MDYLLKENTRGVSPLDNILLKKDASRVVGLLKHGAYIDKKIIINKATEAGDEQFPSELANQLKEQSIDLPDGKTWLHIAAEKGFITLANRCLKKGYSSEVEDGLKTYLYIMLQKMDMTI